MRERKGNERLTEREKRERERERERERREKERESTRLADHEMGGFMKFSWSKNSIKFEITKQRVHLCKHHTIL